MRTTVWKRISKEFIVLLTIKLISVALIGCQRIANASEKNAAVDTDQFNSVSLDNSIQDQSFWNPDNHCFTRADDGKYYFIDDTEFCIKVMDPDTGKAHVVCDRADCDHCNPECSAYLDSLQYCLGSLYYYQEHLCFICTNNGKYTVIQSDLDGGNRKEVMVLGNRKINGSPTSFPLTFSEGYIYYENSNLVNLTEQNSEFVRCSLTDGSTDVIVGPEDYGSDRVMDIKSYGGKIFFLIGTRKLNIEEHRYEYDNRGLFCYDDQSGQITQITSNNQLCDYAIDVKNHNLYYETAGEGLYKMNLDDGENNLINMDDKDRQVTLSWDGDSIYVRSKGDSDCIIRVLNADGDQKQKITAGYRQICFGDSKYLFAYNKGLPNDFQIIRKADMTSDSKWKSIETE